MPLFKRVAPLLLLPLVAALGACSSPKPKFQDDQLFSSTASPFSRNFDASATDACDAARRGLLSQGYMTTMTRTDAVDATKNFQPAIDTHIVVEVHVVCAPGDVTNSSVVYVNAVQNGYALKKSDTSASVGLSIFGSLSVPIRTNNDAMVKISSETIQSGSFYDKFFGLLGRYLRNTARSEPVPHGAIEITPLPPAASPEPVAAVTTPSPPQPRPPSQPTPAAAFASAAGMRAATVPTAASAIETTASIQPTIGATTDAATTAAANATASMTTIWPGIGEPPILAAPASRDPATALAQNANAAASPPIAAQPAAPAAGAPASASASVPASAPAPASAP